MDGNISEVSDQKGDSIFKPVESSVSVNDTSNDNFGFGEGVRRNVRPSFGRRSAGSKSTRSVRENVIASNTESLTSRSCSSAKIIQDLFNDKDTTNTSEHYKNLNQKIEILGDKLEQTNISDTLEDSWNYLQMFNIKQKGRFGTSEDDRGTKDVTSLDQLHERNIFPEESLVIDIPGKSHSIDVEINDMDKFIQITDKTDNVESGDQVFGPDFIIPELPEGNLLEINIKTTWGDKHYLGLNAYKPMVWQNFCCVLADTCWVERFSLSNVSPAIPAAGTVTDIQQYTEKITAEPSDINILPEYNKDPRIVENLLNGNNLTQDDMNMWLTPYIPHSNHYIRIEFAQTEKLAMLRIWNYNKSRIHSYRGARDVEIKFNNKLIFVGEIERASGEILSGINVLGDTILFTTDENILELVALNDEYYFTKILHHEENPDIKMEELRPFTGSKSDDVRPYTCPRKRIVRRSKHGLQKYMASHGLGTTYRSHKFSRTKRISSVDEEAGRKQRSQHFRNLDITNLEDIVANDLEIFMVDRRPRRQNTLEEERETGGSDRWNDVTRSEDFEENAAFGGTDFRSGDTFKVLNTRKDKQQTDSKRERRVKLVPSKALLSADTIYETVTMPCGFNFTIQIHSTWGDPYYVGLNGLQLFDERGNRIKIQRSNISANPESVNILDGIKNDARTPDKLIDGVNDTLDGCHMWLAPVLPLTINRIDITFHLPVTISKIKLWNYAKTPSRGVREFGVLVDGLLVFNGELQQANITNENGFPSIPSHTVNFSGEFTSLGYRSRNRSDVRQRERKETSSGSVFSVDQSQRPFTTMTDFN